MKNNSVGIYYISLKKDIERRNKLKEQFPKYFKEMIHIPAIYGKDLNVNEYYERAMQHLNHTKRLISPGELGCLMSHEEALKTFFLSDNDYALMLEDDVIGTDSDLNKIEKILSKINHNCFIHCGGMDGRRSAEYIYGKECLDDKDLCKLAKFSYEHLWRACCYIVDKKTAVKLLDIYQSNTVVADEWNKILKKLNTQIFVTNILHHPIELKDSNLEYERLQKITKKNFFYYLKKMKNKLNNMINIFLLKFLSFTKVYM